MSNRKKTSIQEAIDLIKQDYEANGRLRLAYVLQTLNKAKEIESQKQQKYDEMLAMLERVFDDYFDNWKSLEQLIKEAKEL